MNTDPEFVQSPHRALWPFPEPAPERRRADDPLLPASHAAHAAIDFDDDEPLNDGSVEMLGRLLVCAAVIVALIAYLALVY